MSATIHNLKIQSNFYTAVVSGQKTFEVRKNDRDYKTGDLLRMFEVDHERTLKIGDTCYTGRDVLVKIKYILEGGQYGVSEDYVVMSIRKIA